MSTSRSELGTWPCPCGNDLTAGGVPCRDEVEAHLPDDERHRTHPPAPDWMVDDALKVAAVDVLRRAYALSDVGQTRSAICRLNDMIGEALQLLGAEVQG